MCGHQYVPQRGLHCHLITDSLLWVSVIRSQMGLSLGPTSSFNWNQQFENSTQLNKAATVMLALERCAAGADDFFFQIWVCRS